MSDIRVPVLPESVADATIATWHKKPGEPVARDENIVDIETDKVVLEVVAPADGMIEKIIKDTGSTVKAEEVIGTFVSKAIDQNVTKSESKPEEKDASKTEPKLVSEPNGTAKSTTSAPNKTLSPAVRRIVNENEIEATNIPGTGKDGRITKQDVEGYLAADSGRLEKRVPMTRLRAKIAERLLAAQHNAAILTTFNEINMQPVISLRAKYKEDFEQKYGVRLGFMSFFVTAAVAALKRFPAVNASIDGNDIVYHGYFDIGIAVSTTRGLVVPILRDADTLSMAEIERQIRTFSQNAQDGKLSMEDITGGTFTITNGGVFGSLMATPILNPPQSGILGMHKIEERPVVENKQIVIKPMMYVALSYDHRIIDGAESVQFLVSIKEMLEEPARLLLSI
jgi:2-oxoglutarate dehydrogenase E2 component (dihydrolipoamide succinyltransferase)